jgi:hypothetical protein
MDHPELLISPVPPSWRQIWFLSQSSLVRMMWAAQEVVSLIHEAKVYKESLKSAFVINRKIVNTAIGRDVGEALATYETHILRASLSQRVIFGRGGSRWKSSL